MKAIPYILLLPLALIVLLTQCEKEPELVNILDDAFLNALIELGVDTNGDGIISPAEAEVVRSLDVSEHSISDMSGIEAFVNIEYLDCWDNNLTSLDVSNNTALTVLDCVDNQITSLDVSYNILLRGLNCAGNGLSSLDVSQNKDLTYLTVYSNDLTSLDVSELTDLKLLDCDFNQLTILDISNNTSITGLSCDYNQLTSLDLSNLLDLHHLECGSNQLTSLDISNNSKLGTVYIGYTCLVINYMPSLQEVCVWTLPFPPEGLNISTTGSPNVYFTTECSK